jgi:RimJ/RimL family protein N-acetyltransferase
MQTPILEGPGVRLEPLTLEHLPALEAIAFDPVIWKYMLHKVETPADLRIWANDALAAVATGRSFVWVTIKKADPADPTSKDQLVGSTRFLDLDLHNRTVEIGHTWLNGTCRGTRVNTEAKLLQLTYAFETLNLVRVALKTNANNQRSQSAIKAIGATYEGTFRSHMIMPDGSHRDSAWFSIIRSEWPEVKDLLNRRLNAAV